MWNTSSDPGISKNLTFRSVTKIIYFQIILNMGILNHLKDHIQYSPPNLQKEAILCLSNILAGHHNHITIVFNAGFIPLIIQLLKNGYFDTQLGAVNCVNIILRFLLHFSSLMVYQHLINRH